MANNATVSWNPQLPDCSMPENRSFCTLTQRCVVVIGPLSPFKRVEWSAMSGVAMDTEADRKMR